MPTAREVDHDFIPRPNAENLRKQAKALLRAWQRGDSEARDRVAAFFPDATRLGLQAAQLVLAREYGFRSWSALIRFVPRMGHLDDRCSTRMRLTVEDRMTRAPVEGFPSGVAKAWNPGVTAGWHEILDVLEHHLTGRQPPDIDYPRLCRFYDRVLAQLIGQGTPRVDQR